MNDNKVESTVPGTDRETGRNEDIESGVLTGDIMVLDRYIGTELSRGPLPVGGKGV